MGYKATGVGPAIVDRLREGDSYQEIATALGCATSTVAYHARKHGLLRGPRPGTPRRTDIDWAAVQTFYDAGHSVRECGVQFGFATGVWSTAVRVGLVIPRPPVGRRPLSDYLVPDSVLHPATRRRLIRDRGGRCESCGISEWLGRPLSLDVHHCNGDSRDNRSANLLVVCPNCHRQQGPLV